jgi:hypothetical protein
MIITRPLNANEPDLLKGLEYATLTVQDLDGAVLFTKVSATAWTHDELERIAAEVVPVFANGNGWNAYLGTLWIGSSEC